jgi:Flp pilus assembly protein TadG
MELVLGDVQLSVLRRAREDESGFTLVFVALTVVVLFTFVAIVIDLGNVRQVARQEQNAADAGTLAGAQSLPASAWSGCGSIPTAVDKAAKYAASTVSSAVPTATDCTTANTAIYTAGGATITVVAPYSGDTQRIHVQLCQTVRYAFAGIIGASSQTPCRQASASHTASVGRCGICVLGSSGQTFTDTMGGNLTVKNADVVINSTGSPAASSNGGGTFSVTGGTIGGPAAPGGFSGNKYSPFPPINEAAVPDPLASLPLCSAASGCPVSASAPDVDLDAHTPAANFTGGMLNPGVYHNISVSNTGGLNPGIYVITGTFHASNSHALTMSGVMLYFACARYVPAGAACQAGDAGGQFNITGGGATTLSPPTSGTYTGVSIFYDRTISQGCGTSTVTPGGGWNVSGTIYMANSCIKFTQGGAGFGSSLVIGSIETTGGGDIVIDPSTGLNAGGTNSVTLFQ